MLADTDRQALRRSRERDTAFRSLERSISLMSSETKDEMWDELLELGVSEQTLQIVTNINGYNAETLEDVLYAHTGYRSFDQLKEE
jgi:hypothetical protein